MPDKKTVGVVICSNHSALLAKVFVGIVCWLTGNDICSLMGEVKMCGGVRRKKLGFQPLYDSDLS